MESRFCGAKTQHATVRQYRERLCCAWQFATHRRRITFALLNSFGLRLEFVVATRPVSSLAHQVERKVFREGPKFAKICPIVLNYVQHIFPEGRKICGGRFAAPGYVPGSNAHEINGCTFCDNRYISFLCTSYSRSIVVLTKYTNICSLHRGRL